MSDKSIRPITEEELIAKIQNMTHLEMAHAWRHAPMGDDMFQIGLPYWPVFKERWEKFGGMTSAVSIVVGWDGKAK